MTFSPEHYITLAAVLEQADEQATKGEWTGEIDCFDHEEIVALVADRETSMLFTAGTEIAPYKHEGGDWTAEDSAKRDAQWAKARETQMLRDARAIAALRNHARSAAQALREACEEAERLKESRKASQEDWQEMRDARDQARALAVEACDLGERLSTVRTTPWGEDYQRDHRDRLSEIRRAVEGK